MKNSPVCCRPTSWGDEDCLDRWLITTQHQHPDVIRFINSLHLHGFAKCCWKDKGRNLQNVKQCRLIKQLLLATWESCETHGNSERHQLTQSGKAAFRSLLWWLLYFLLLLLKSISSAVIFLVLWLMLEYYKNMDALIPWHQIKQYCWLFWSAVILNYCFPPYITLFMHM